MGVFNKAEKRIESAVEKVFARAFKGDVQPVEITARLQRELDSEAKLLNRERKLVPNDFTVQLSKHDHDRLAPYSKMLNSEVIPQLRDYAADKGYIFNGPVTIDYELDDSLPTGRFTVTSAAVAGVDGSDASSSQIRRANLVIEVNGVRHPLNPPGVVLGRGTEADLRINDPGISRQHARVVVSTDEGLEDAFRFTEDFSLRNGCRRQVHDPVFDILSLGFAFAEADPRERRIDEDRVREGTAVLCRPVAFAAHVRHDDTAVVEGNIGELQIAADVTGCPDVRNIGPQVFIGYDGTAVRQSNAGLLSFETIRVRTAAGSHQDGVAF